MPDSPSAALVPAHRSLLAKQPEWSGALADGRRRATLVRRAREQQRSARARQLALVAAWLRELMRT